MEQTKTRVFSRILVAIDGSETSLRADYAIEIAEENNADLLIAIHVLDSRVGYAYSSDIYGLVTPTSISDLLEDIKKELRSGLIRLNKKLMI